MPLKMNDGIRERHHSTTAADLPEHIIICILKFLPVKSIIRFKCVSKEWLSLFSSPKFISMHHEQASNNPLEHFFIIRSINKDHHRHEISLVSSKSIGRGPVSLINPFPIPFEKMELVGSINGLICLSCPPRGRMTVLWNPAMNLYKVISLCIPKIDTDNISVGFAHVNDDYKIIVINFVERKYSNPDDLFRYRVEVYSTNLDSWRRVQIDSPFDLSNSRNSVIVKGIPYWTGFIHQGSNHVRLSTLVYYDMRNRSFKHVELPSCASCSGIGMRYVEWKGNLGMMVSSSNKCKADLVDIFLYDEIGMCWNRLSSHGPVEMKVERYIQWSRNGVILAETSRGRLKLYDPLANEIKKFSIPGALKHSFDALGYTESLVTVEGMEQLKEKS